MRDWKRHVREHLHLPELTGHREERIVEELAGQLEDLYETARSWGSTETEAEQYALAAVPDWRDLATSIAVAEHSNRRPAGDRILERMDGRLRNHGRRSALLADLLQDVRLAARHMRQAPGFTAAVVLCLGVGIGANVALFETATSVLRPDVPIQEPERLVQVYMMWDHGNVYAPFSIPDYEDVRDQVDAFERVAAWGMSAFNVTLNGEVERTWGAMISGNYFQTLGITPELGRDFSPAEYAVPERHPVAVISHSLWSRRFGADPGAIGRTVQINGTSFTVIGVVDRRFSGPMVGVYADIYVPLAMRASALPGWSYFGRSNHWLTSVVARLRPGVSLDRAQAEVDALMESLRDRYPTSNQGGNALVLGMEDSLLHPVLRPGFQAVFALLAVVVVVLLLLTCANVGGLMLARSAARQQEFGVRLALGASRGRLVRQVSAESLLYALCAGVAAYLFVLGAIPAVLSLQPPIDRPIHFDARLGAVSAWLTPLVALVAAFLCGLAPALEAARRDAGGRSASGRRAGRAPLQRMRHALVGGQVAASTLLLVGAAMALRHLQGMANVDLGFNPEHQVIARIDLSAQGHDERRGRAFYGELRERLLQLPGVRAVGLSRTLVLNFDRRVALVWPQGWESPHGQPESVSRNLVDAGYFDAMEVPLIRGRVFRTFGEGDVPRALVINERFAERYWPGEMAVGKRVRLDNRDRGPIYEVIGVVADGKYRFVGEDPEPHIYRSFERAYFGDMYVHVRTAGDPASYVGDVRRIVQRLDPDVAFAKLSTMSDQLRFALLPSRLIAWSESAFALVALSLTMIGLYGLVSHTVSQRTREIGLRMAMGAGGRRLIREVLGRLAKHATVGLAVGLGLGMLGSIGVSRVLIEVSPFDPLAVGSALLLICGAVVVAGYLPARRATRINPMSALNCE